METKVNLDAIYKPSEDVVARDIYGEFIIIPIISGMTDSEDEIYSLNETGRAIWNKLDGVRSLKEVINDLSAEFAGPINEIEQDVLGITEELYKRRMVIEIKDE